MLALLLLLPALAAASVLPPGTPFVLQELRRHKVNLAVLEALFERIFTERDPDAKEAFESHFRSAFQRSFQDASGWLHLAVTSQEKNPHSNVIVAAWKVYEDRISDVQRLLEQEVMSLMALASKLKMAFYSSGSTEEMVEVKAALTRQSAEMTREIQASLEAFREVGWRSYLPKRLAQLQAEMQQQWMLASKAVQELQERLVNIFPFRTFLVISFDKHSPPSICSNGSNTATEHRLNIADKEWDLAVLSIPAKEAVDGRQAVRFFSSVPKSETAFFCKSETVSIFRHMKIPCGSGQMPLVVAVVSAEEDVFSYAIAERPVKQLKVAFVKRSFPLLCERFYALMGLGGD